MEGMRHIVLVPGFVGFDALGSLRYYAGITELFEDWRSRDARVMLHYFDNFPTASVATRAKRLEDFLAKRVARGVFADGDEITLVGHSTGGLDIRKLLERLGPPGAAPRASTLAPVPDHRPVTVDASAEVPVVHIRDLIKRIVFLSVPHYGTNIANYAHAFEASLKRTFANSVEALRLNVPVVSLLRELQGDAKEQERWPLLQAILDTLYETDLGYGLSEIRGADERQARYELLLWLDHMTHDFDAIDDLRAPAFLRDDSRPRWRRIFSLRDQGAPASGDDLDGLGTASPAHFTPERRQKELENWRGLSVRSYATWVDPSHVAADRLLPLVQETFRVVGRAPAAAVAWSGKAVSATLGNRWLSPALLRSIAAFAKLGVFEGPVLVPALLSPRLLFEGVYGLCARTTGPFRAPVNDATYQTPPKLTVCVGTSEGEGGEVELGSADNDGIVNTLSMCWPRPGMDGFDHEIYLVHADHADVIGHCGVLPARDESARRYEGYDLLESGSRFARDAELVEVWSQIFEFGAGVSQTQSCGWSAPPAHAP